LAGVGGRMFDCVVTQRINPGREAEFEALLRELEASTLASDQGCLRYEWYRAELPQTYTLLERWTDRSAAEAHLRAPHFLALLPKLRDCATEWFTIVRLARLDPRHREETGSAAGE
jgi:quinol monooxygenase YgiN